MSLEDEQFDQALNSPSPWLDNAEYLRNAARQFDWMKMSLTDRPIRSTLVYRLLFGFAMENLIKGILIAHGHHPYDGTKLKKDFASHKLSGLAAKFDSTRLSLSSQEFAVLDRMEPYAVWAGRYPIALKRADQLIRGHSSVEYQEEIDLYDRLRAHMAEVGWFLDFDGKRVPMKRTPDPGCDGASP